MVLAVVSHQHYLGMLSHLMEINAFVKQTKVFYTALRIKCLSLTNCANIHPFAKRVIQHFLYCRFNGFQLTQQLFLSSSVILQASEGERIFFYLYGYPKYLLS